VARGGKTGTSQAKGKAIRKREQSESGIGHSSNSRSGLSFGFRYKSKQLKSSALKYTPQSMECRECVRLKIELERAKHAHASMCEELKASRPGQETYMHLRTLEHDARVGLYVAERQIQQHRAVCNNNSRVTD
jgi:hypothetical protein